jgi:Fe-only nitrogenase accessory protein AnfO
MCNAEIAVMTGSDGTTVPINGPGSVIVFRRERGQWRTDRSLPFSLGEGGGLMGLRRQMAALTEFLGGCRTFVAQSAGGAAFFELEKARCTVFELPGRPDEFLDAVWRDSREEEPPAPAVSQTAIPAPVEVAPGRFAISIREIQGKRPELSSKQVLRSFVQRGEFTDLEIRCDHMPPWLEVDADRCGYDLSSEYTGPNELLVRVRKNPGGCC